MENANRPMAAVTLRATVTNSLLANDATQPRRILVIHVALTPVGAAHSVSSRTLRISNVCAREIAVANIVRFK